MDRISPIIAVFNSFINDTTNYLLAAPAPPPSAADGSGSGGGGAVIAVQPNYVRLGITDSEMNQWSNYRSQWNALYPKYTQKKETRTTAITDQLRSVQKNFRKFAQPLIGRIQFSVNVTIDDLREFNIKSAATHDANPTHSRTMADEAPYFTMKALGGGDMRIRVRTTEHGKHASMLPDFMLEFRYAFLPQDEPRHLQIADLNLQQISTKAIFTLHCGTDKQGKLIFAACRWVNLVDPSRNSPWSGIMYLLVG